MAQTQETEESKPFCCKNYQQRKKGSARLLVLGVYPPPAGAVPRYYPYAKVISGARSDLCAACNPPTRGKFPLLPVCKSYQTVHETPLRALFRGFRVYISIDKGQHCPRTTPLSRALRRAAPLAAGAELNRLWRARRRATERGAASEQACSIHNNPKPCPLHGY